MERPVPLKEDYYLYFPRDGGLPTQQVHRGKAPVLVRRQKGVRKGISHSLYWGFRRKAKTGQGKQFWTG